MKATVKITIPIRIKKKGDWFVSSNRMLDVHSQGRTREQAKDNLRDALETFFESGHERGV